MNAESFDTERLTPFAASAPDAARALAARCLAHVRLGAIDDARDDAESALFLLESILHDEAAARTSLAVGDALVTLAAAGPWMDHVWTQRAREALDRLGRATSSLPAVRASAGPRRAFGDP